MKHDWSRGEAWGKGTAAFVGSTSVAVAFLILAGGIPARLGIDPHWGAALGVWLAAPVWTGVVLAALLARTGLGAWTVVGATMAVSAAAAAWIVAT